MQQLLLIVHVLLAVGIIALVLLQQGKGSDVGAAFGSGSSNSMLGALGATSLLFKITAVLVTLFFASCLLMDHMAVRQVKARGASSAPVVKSAVLPSLPVAGTAVKKESKSAPSQKKKKKTGKVNP